MELVFDIEGNGLWPECDTVWCIVTYDPAKQWMNEYGPTEIQAGVERLSEADTLVGHNVLGYDLPVLEKLWALDYHSKTVIDTLVWSRTLKPERWNPKGWNPKNGGPHSLGAWGHRFGYPKVEHEDWTKFSPEMMERCKVDVEINNMLYEKLKKERAEWETR